MSRRRGWIAALGLVAALLAAAPAWAAPPAPAQAFSAAAATLGEVELAQLQKARPGATVLTSPLSIEAALAMTAAGARGETAREMRAALGLTDAGLSLPDAAKAFAALRVSLAAAPGVILDLANGVWVDQRVTLDPAFAKIEAGPFAARIASADFANPATAASINAFVSQATRGKITEIVGALTPADRLVLVNALYFKGVWQTPFDPTQTRPAPFNLAGGRTIQAPTMHREGAFAYYETDAFQSVALPYGDGRFELVLLLMKDSAATPPAKWPLALPDNRYDTRAGSVALPKLDLSWGGDLTASLNRAGLSAAMSPKADFSGVGRSSGGPLFIQQVLHKTRLLVDEQGTVGAAATAVMMPAGACMGCTEPQPFVFKADRPFWLLLRDTETGAPVFLGYVAAPTS
jgi:serpin B